MVSFLTEPSLYFDETIQPLFFLKPSNPAEGPTCVSDSCIIRFHIIVLRDFD
jgi:hypothetical protein